MRIIDFKELRALPTGSIFSEVGSKDNAARLLELYRKCQSHPKTSHVHGTRLTNPKLKDAEHLTNLHSSYLSSESLSIDSGSSTMFAHTAGEPSPLFAYWEEADLNWLRKQLEPEADPTGSNGQS